MLSAFFWAARAYLRIGTNISENGVASMVRIRKTMKQAELVSLMPNITTIHKIGIQPYFFTNTVCPKHITRIHAFYLAPVKICSINLLPRFSNDSLLPGFTLDFRIVLLSHLIGH